jgi:hypothetical protein
MGTRLGSDSGPILAQSRLPICQEFQPLGPCAPAWESAAALEIPGEHIDADDPLDARRIVRIANLRQQRRIVSELFQSLISNINHKQTISSA